MLSSVTGKERVSNLAIASSAKRTLEECVTDEIIERVGVLSGNITKKNIKFHIATQKH